MIVKFWRICISVDNCAVGRSFSRQMLNSCIEEGKLAETPRRDDYWLLAASSPCGVMRIVEPSRSMTGSVNSPEFTVMGQVLLQAGGR